MVKFKKRNIIIVFSLVFICTFLFSTKTYAADYDFSDMVSRLWSISDYIREIPEKAADKIKEAISQAFMEYYKGELTRLTGVIELMLGGFKGYLMNDSMASGFAISLSNGLKPIAYSLVGLFFVIDFCKRTIYFEVMNYIQIVIPLIKLTFAKYIVDNSFRILNLILDINREIVGKVFEIESGFNSRSIADFGTINNPGPITKVFDLAIFYWGKSIFFLLVIVLIALCYVIANIRLIELSVLGGLSPIFFATIAADVTNDVFKSYIKNYIAVAMQSVFMAVGLAFLSTGFTGYFTKTAGFSSGLSMLIGVLTLTIYVLKAPASVRNAIGGAGGTSVNLVQLATLATQI